ncbi:MAG: hypothetical protein M1422_01750 [Candidatus Thermoplasmatota archaeon]|jgi:hypothetical protein|nr:hypothetical protein [Candidatus Thermoplasmatota archaeon]
MITDNEGKLDSNDLAARIRSEMTVDYANALERCFDIAKRLVRITNEGKIFLVQKETLTGEDRILLYLIGKLYAKEGGLAATEDVSNEELANELGMRMGSIFPWTMNLRKGGKIRTQSRDGISYHAVNINLVEPELNRLYGLLNPKE